MIIKRVLLIIVGLLAALSISGPAQAAVPTDTAASTSVDGRWLPTADSKLDWYWALSDPINVNNVCHVGLCTLGGTTAILTAPAVIDIDGEFNTAATVD